MYSFETTLSLINICSSVNRCVFTSWQISSRSDLKPRILFRVFFERRVGPTTTRRRTTTRCV